MRRKERNGVVNTYSRAMCTVLTLIVFLHQAEGLASFAVQIGRPHKPALTMKGGNACQAFKKGLAAVLMPLAFVTAPLGGGGGIMPALLPARADDELAKFAAEGNAVGVDGTCFMKKCALETTSCANDPSCLKGLSCLARCKGGSMCSTGCFAKYGSDRLDNLLACTVEKNDCVHVPREANSGWKADTIDDLPSMPLARFKPESLDGTWFKVTPP